MIAGDSAGGTLALLGAYADDQVPPGCVNADASVKAVVVFSPTPDAVDADVRPGQPPTLLIHGDRDHVAPYRTSAKLADQLSKAGVHNELVTIPWGEHGFEADWNSWGTQIARQVTDRFLRENFPA